jgi:hypothetical protein
MTIPSPNIAIRRPSAGWGLSRLSIMRGVFRRGTIGSSLRWSNGVHGKRDLPLTPSVCVARWMLKQVQHDAGRSIPPRPLRLCVNSLICHSRESGNTWAELSEKRFAQRHEGTKRLLPVFVSSCELKSFYARQYRTRDSRFRGNDNFGVLGCVNGYARHPELVCANTPADLGSISRLVPSVCVARWMLKQVQHDAGKSIALRPLRRCVKPNPRRPNIYATLS